MSRMKISKGEGMKGKIVVALVTVGMIVSVASAADVTKFKIDGIGLGDSYDKIKQKLPCQNKISDGIGGSNILCWSGNQDLRIDLNSNGKIYVIDKKMKNQSESDIELIQQNAVKKYGKPNASGTKMYSDKSYATTMLLWGSDCYVQNASIDDREMVGEEPKCNFQKNSFMIYIKHYENSIQFQTISRDIEQAHVHKTPTNNNQKQSSSSHYNSWSTVSKNTIRDSSNSSQNFESTDIKCADGTKGYINDFYNLSTTYRYFANGKSSFKSFEEAANYICGNK